MIVLGVLLLVFGLVLPLPVLFWIGILLLLVGILFFALGSAGRPVGGRRYWF